MAERQLYPNGGIPDSVVSVVLGSGRDSKGRYWEWRCTPIFAARWAIAKRYAEEHFGRTLHIRSGANLYRDRGWQRIARSDACAAGNCNGASVEGYSSHGGYWGGRNCLAIDVDPNGLSWDQVDKAMAYAGFAVGLITEKISGIKGGERWHYILFIALDATPASNNATPVDTSRPNRPKEWDEMASKDEIKDGQREVARESGETIIISYASPNERNGTVLAKPGFWHKFSNEEWAQFKAHNLDANIKIVVPINDRDYDVLKSVYIFNEKP